MKTKYPEKSLIKNFLPANYSDVYTYKGQTDSLNADDIQIAFWTKSPKWVETLFRIRNTLVKLVGLDGGGKDIAAVEECIRSGGKYNMMSIPAKSDNETVLKLEDSHLSAHISIHIQDLENNEKLVSATTLVHFHKKIGYVYFYTIYPFHHIVVRQMLKRAVLIAMN